MRESEVFTVSSKVGTHIPQTIESPGDNRLFDVTIESVTNCTYRKSRHDRPHVAEDIYLHTLTSTADFHKFNLCLFPTLAGSGNL